MKGVGQEQGVGMPRQPPNTAWVHLLPEIVLPQPAPEKKEVAWQLVHSKMCNNGQREDQRR